VIFSYSQRRKLAMFLFTITYGCHHGSRNSKNSAAYKRGTIGIIVLKHRYPGINVNDLLIATRFYILH